jgi:predicted PurR-regulated permease PerM
MEGQRSAEGIRFSRRTKTTILLVGAGLFAWLLLQVQAVLAPFVWGAVTAYIFNPVVDWLEMRTRLARVWLVVLLYLVGLAAMVWASVVFVPLVIKQAGDLLADVPRILEGLLASLAFLEERLQAEPIRALGLTLDPQELANQAVRSLQTLFGYVTRHAIPAVFNVLGGMAQVLLCLVVAFYLLKGSRTLRTRLQALFPASCRHEALELIARIDRVLGAYIRGQLLLIGVMSAAMFVPLSILRVRYALVIALASGVLMAIPWLGPFLAGGIAVLVALFQPSTPFGWSNLTLALVVALAYLVLRQIETQLVVPVLVGPMVDLHPLLVLFALISGGKLGGLTGLIISVPTAAALKIIAAYLYHKIWEDQASGEELPDASAVALAGEAMPGTPAVASLEERVSSGSFAGHGGLPPASGERL